MRARIRDKSIVGQDHHSVVWNDDGTVFDVERLQFRLYRCRAKGYGDLTTRDAYGNGAIFVRRLWELIPVEDRA